MEKKTLTVKCPGCKKSFNYYDSEFRPFCCERCQKIDLGHWFSETYVVPTKESTIESSDETKIDTEINDEHDDSEYEY